MTGVSCLSCRVCSTDDDDGGGGGGGNYIDLPRHLSPTPSNTRRTFRPAAITVHCVDAGYMIAESKRCPFVARFRPDATRFKMSPILAPAGTNGHYCHEVCPIQQGIDAAAAA